MRPGFRHIWTAIAPLLSMAPGISRAADIGWPEAVARLAGARTRAETCAAVLKEYGDEQQISRGQLAYGEAKANFDAVIPPSLKAENRKAFPVSKPIWNMAQRVLGNSARWSAICCQALRG